MQRDTRDTQDGRGLAGQDSPGGRSGEGSGSVMDQMQKDEQRNANHSEGEHDSQPGRESAG